MLSTLKSKKLGTAYNQKLDYMTARERWFALFPQTGPKDVLQLYDWKNENKAIREINKTKAARSGKLVHVKTETPGRRMEEPAFSGGRMMLHDICGKMEEHFCTAIHPIYTNEENLNDALNSRVQLATEAKIFIPCGVKMIITKSRDGNDKNYMVGTKFNRCGCGKLRVAAGTTTGPDHIAYLSFCDQDMPIATVNPGKIHLCEICQSEISYYEAHPTTWKNPDFQDIKPKIQLCVNCLPMRSIFSLLMKRGYQPITTGADYERMRNKWKTGEVVRPFDSARGAFVSINYHTWYERLHALVLNDDPIFISTVKNSMWLRDLTREGVESNPGPDYISQLNIDAQRKQIHFPLYEDEKVLEANSFAFKITCYYLEHKTEAVGISKKQAKHEAAKKMWEKINNLE
ncbi:NSP1 [Rotavirus J]|uniref:NSP1 n=1 Tax=Rotavirus J TaxID=1929964 RepID=A0A1L6BXK6_9REOV|nr:NSP1 [Rotavirus J]APQ41747.1 NSP1 [Rotavirus J]